MDVEKIDVIVQKITSWVKQFEDPVVTRVAKEDFDPFKILISTILSLRTKDETTYEASKRLFGVADTPEKILALSEEEIEKLIYPVGFYHKKAKVITGIAKRVIELQGVPDKMEELLKMPGVGRKTANILLSEYFGKGAIAVDTHVHRISNRLGIVETRTAEKTEYELMKVLPEKYWSTFNRIFVPFGQHVCKPVSPLCSTCPVESLCPKIGVKKHR